MLKSLVLAAVRELSGDFAEKSRMITMIHLARDWEIQELAQYSSDPRDIAIYLSEVVLSPRIIETKSAIRVLGELAVSNCEDTHNNVGRFCSQPYDCEYREWFVAGCISPYYYVLHNLTTGEYRIANIRTMGNLY